MVYLVHLERDYKHARHYIGFVNGDETLEQRIAQHRKGDGAKFLRAVSQAGIEFSVVRVWPEGDRKLERKLKNWKNSKLLCPICREEKRRYIQEWRKNRRD